MTKNW